MDNSNKINNTHLANNKLKFFWDACKYYIIIILFARLIFLSIFGTITNYSYQIFLLMFYILSFLISYRITKKYNKGIIDALIINFYFSLIVHAFIYFHPIFVFMSLFSGLFLMHLILPAAVISLIGGTVGFLTNKNIQKNLKNALGVPELNEKHKNFIYSLLYPLLPFFLLMILDIYIIPNKIHILFLLFAFCFSVYLIIKTIIKAFKQKIWILLAGLIISPVFYAILYFILGLYIE